MPTIRKAYKYRLKTNKEIEDLLTRFCGSSRFLWYNELAFWLTVWKRSEEYGFLKECLFTGVAAEAEGYGKGLQGLL